MQQAADAVQFPRRCTRRVPRSSAFVRFRSSCHDCYLFIMRSMLHCAEHEQLTVAMLFSTCVNLSAFGCQKKYFWTLTPGGWLNLDLQTTRCWARRVSARWALSESCVRNSESCEQRRLREMIRITSTFLAMCHASGSRTGATRTASVAGELSSVSRGCRAWTCTSSGTTAAP